MKCNMFKSLCVMGTLALKRSRTACREQHTVQISYSISDFI